MKKLRILLLGVLLSASFVSAKDNKNTFFDWVDSFSGQQHLHKDKVAKLLLRLEVMTDVDRQNELRQYWQNTNAYDYDDPMMVHLLSESLRVFSKSDPIKSYILSKVEFGKLQPSCESDALITRFSDLKSQNTYQSDLASLKSMKQKINKRSFVYKMIKKHKGQHEKLLSKDLWPIVKDDQVVLRKNLWLFEGQKKLPAERELELTVRSQLSKRQCKLAEKTIKESTVKDMPVKDLVDLGDRVYKCIKRRGKKKVIQFFDRYANILYQKSSYVGWAAGKLRLAKYMWGTGNFEESKNIIKSVIKLSKEKKLDYTLGDARFLLGEVVQNEGGSRESIHIFDTFRKKHPFHENYSKALMKLTILEGSRKNWSKVETVAGELEHIGTKLAKKKTDPAELAFGLFWQSVAKHKMKDQKSAIKIWKKLAKDSFSSYYGAVSSYMLEKYGIAPPKEQISTAQNFEHQKYFDSFNKDDRKTLSYAQKLIHLGLHQSAACELKHMEDKSFRDEQKMFVSALLYLSHDWLSMVIKYNSIPRSVRKNFPVGVETMMFPKKFDDQIAKYAKKLGLEDEFIMAIIRQESIFNPRAKSWAGARGLMQLMPQTARREAKKIKKDYLEPEERIGLKGLRSSKDKLFDHNVNIALGIHHVKSLFDVYKSPLFVLTSYNASPRATKRWKKNITFDDKLLFIEKIPYKETRAYAKLVFRNYYYYKKLYKPNSSPKLLSKILTGSFPVIDGDHKIKL